MPRLSCDAYDNLAVSDEVLYTHNARSYGSCIGSVNSFALKCWFGRELQQTPKRVKDMLRITTSV